MGQWRKLADFSQAVTTKDLKNNVTKTARVIRPRSLTATGWLLLAGAIGPALIALRIQKKYWINIPIWDEWDTPALALLNYVQGTLTWGDLLAHHNESRKVVSRLIHIAVATVAGWDVRQGMVLTFLCACAASAFALVFLRRRTGLSVSYVLVPWLLINLLLFAPSQYENFLSGCAFEFFIPFLLLFACCGINLSRWTMPTKVVCNSFLALLSTYTFAHGMLLWACAIPIPIREERSPRGRFFLLWIAIYVATGILSIACYFLVGYRRPDIFPPPPGLNQIGRLLEFMIVWLGALVRSPFVNAHLSGALVSVLIVSALAGTFVVLRKNRERWPAYYPWLLLLGFALSSGAMIALGRVNIGVDNVFNTWLNGFSGMHYNVTSVFAYIAVIGLLFNFFEDRIRSAPRLRIRFLFGVAVCGALLAVAWIGMFSEELIRLKQFQDNRRRARTAVIWSDALPRNPELLLAYPFPEGFPPRVAQMRAAGLLNLPKVSDSLRQAISSVPSGGKPETGELEVSEPWPGHFWFKGWARSPSKKAAADYVVLGWQGPDNSFHPFTAIPTGRVRPKVEEEFGPLSEKSGFDQEVDISALPPEVTIRAWAIDWDSQEAFPMDNFVRVDRVVPAPLR